MDISNIGSTDKTLQEATIEQLEEWLSSVQQALAYDSGQLWKEYESEIEQIEQEIKRRKDAGNG